MCCDTPQESVKIMPMENGVKSNMVSQNTYWHIEINQTNHKVFIHKEMSL